MGEIAEMMLNGILDCDTGEYIGGDVGYPRTRNKTNNPDYGVVNWLENHRMLKSKQKRYEAIMQYGKEFLPEGTKYYQVCEFIQKGFPKFCGWFIKNYEK